MEEFNFESDSILKALSKASKGKGIEFIGSATSHFQAEPVIYNAMSDPLSPVSDWEFELSNNLNGKPTHIRHFKDPKKLPRFLELKDRYLQRSKELGENMFRFSFDFARLCPAEGRFDDELMTEYVKLIALIKSNDQEPLITLHHFTMPLFLTVIDEKTGTIKRGAWEHPDILKHFKFYVENVVRFLNDRDKLRSIFLSEGYRFEKAEQLCQEGLVRFFITINEPAVTPVFSYLTKAFPPYKFGKIVMAERVLKKMVAAHDIAYLEIKKLGEGRPKERKPKVGLGYAWPYFDGIFSRIVKAVNNRYMRRFERDGSHSDFIGVHYYFRTTSSFFYRRHKRDYSEHPGFGDIYPVGVLNVLRDIHRAYPSKEIFISEIGFADSHDQRKPYWLAETIRYIFEAKKEGIPIRAIVLWSMVNNFEWELGMDAAKFGLFSEVDLERPLTPSIKGIHSWEVWQAVTKIVTSPSISSMQELQVCYLKAKEQYQQRLRKSLGID